MWLGAFAMIPMVWPQDPPHDRVTNLQRFEFLLGWAICATGARLVLRAKGHRGGLGQCVGYGLGLLGMCLLYDKRDGTQVHRATESEAS